MVKTKKLSDIIKVLESHEKRISVLEGKKQTHRAEEAKSWYRPGSTIDKIMTLIEKGVFNVPRGISDIISELEAKDYHLKAPDLTLPLRKIVRKGLLARTKKAANGSISKKWLYVKA
jgi:hypothetical protein